MKKIIFLLICVCFLTGCSSVVELNIDEDSVYESISVSANSVSEYNEIKNWSGFPLTLYVDQELENPWSGKVEEGVPYYNVNFDDSNKSALITGNFSLKNHVRSSIIKNCFDYYNIVSGKNGSTIFSTSRGLTCKFQEFSLIVKTPYLVISNNADSVDEESNTYTWVINKKNYEDINVYLELDFSSKYNEFDSELIDNSSVDTDVSDSNNITVLLLLFGSVFIILVFGILYLKKKKDKNSMI